MVEAPKLRSTGRVPLIAIETHMCGHDDIAASRRRAMAKPEITVTEQGDFKLVLFLLPGGVTTPEEFVEETSRISDQLPGPKAVLINGRGPIWAYGMLMHAAHPSPAVGTFDPRLGYVIVASHDMRYTLGQIVASDFDQQQASI